MPIFLSPSLAVHCCLRFQFCRHSIIRHDSDPFVVLYSADLSSSVEHRKHYLISGTMSCRLGVIRSEISAASKFCLRRTSLSMENHFSFYFITRFQDFADSDQNRLPLPELFHVDCFHSSFSEDLPLKIGGCNIHLLQEHSMTDC